MQYVRSISPVFSILKLFVLLNLAATVGKRHEQLRQEWQEWLETLAVVIKIGKAGQKLIWAGSRSSRPTDPVRNAGIEVARESWTAGKR